MSNYTQFGIFMTLLDGKLHKANDLAEKFEISTKTVYRNANKLVYAGFPITTFAGKNGGIMLAEKFKCQTWFFSEKELAYISNLAASSNFEPETSSVICTKIQELIAKENFDSAKNHTSRFFVDTSNWFSKKPNSAKAFSPLFDACVQNKEIEIIYGDNTQTRVVRPYCIVQKEGNYYLYAFCTNKEQFRLFKICRINSYKVLNTQFERQNISLETMPWNKSQCEKTTITIKANKNVANEICSWADCIQTDKDTYLLHATVNSGLIHKIMEYGNSITVLEPKAIIDKILDECKIIANNYAKH